MEILKNDTDLELDANTSYVVEVVEDASAPVDCLCNSVGCP